MIKTRTRRTAEQHIADLEAKIAAIRARAERQKVKRDPALKHLKAAVRSIDMAVAQSADAATKKALAEARSTLSACLALSGFVVPSGGPASRASGRRRSQDVGDGFADTLLDYVVQHPGQRGEQIAAALGTDTTSMRPSMHELIEARKVRTKGQRRGMTYAAV